MKHFKFTHVLIEVLRVTSLIAFYRKSSILEGTREKRGAVLLAAVTVVDATEEFLSTIYRQF